MSHANLTEPEYAAIANMDHEALYDFAVATVGHNPIAYRLQVAAETLRAAGWLIQAPTSNPLPQFNPTELRNIETCILSVRYGVKTDCTDADAAKLNALLAKLRSLDSANGAIRGAVPESDPFDPTGETDLAPVDPDPLAEEPGFDDAFDPTKSAN